MKQSFIILIIFGLLTSCANKINHAIPKPNPSVPKIRIYTTEPSIIISNNDTIKTIKNKAQLPLRTRKESVEFISITDSLNKRVRINSKKTLEKPVKTINPKRYGYPVRIYLNSSDTLNKVYKYDQSNNKGQLLLSISFPYVNYFQLHPDNETAKRSIGFLGVSTGLDYYYDKNQYIHLSISKVIDFPAPFPVPIYHSEGVYESVNSTYYSLSNNHKIKQFSLGYGISYGRNNWNYTILDGCGCSSSPRDQQKGSNAFGLLFSSYYQPRHNFNIGLIYRPTFIRFNTGNNVQYEHLISIDLAWRIPLIGNNNFREQKQKSRNKN